MAHLENHLSLHLNPGGGRGEFADDLLSRNSGLSDSTKMITETSGIKLKKDIEDKTLERAYELMCTARAMSDLFEEKSQISSKYVHACSRGH